jgi:hypothetical protein
MVISASGSGYFPPGSSVVVCTQTDKQKKREREREIREVGRITKPGKQPRHTPGQIFKVWFGVRKFVSVCYDDNFRTVYLKIV